MTSISFVDYTTSVTVRVSRRTLEVYAPFIEFLENFNPSFQDALTDAILRDSGLTSLPSKVYIYGDYTPTELACGDNFTFYYGIEDDWEDIFD